MEIAMKVVSKEQGGEEDDHGNESLIRRGLAGSHRRRNVRKKSGRCSYRGGWNVRKRIEEMKEIDGELGFI